VLILTRKLDERILVPQCGLSITVIAVHGKTVQLGFSAPAEIEIFREEIWERIREQTDCPLA
jgi:carbon storage regulator